MLEIKTVTILGANGTMGSRCAGLIANLGKAEVFMAAKTLQKARESIVRAINASKSLGNSNRFIPTIYDSLSECIPQCDWVLEAVSEDIHVKHSLNRIVSQYVKPNTIISTTSSGLSISDLALDFNQNLQANYFGTHFFNPPSKLLLCELIPNPHSDRKLQKDLFVYLEKVLQRKVILSNDTPAFIANRIGFDLLNNAAIYGEKYGIAYIDYLLGRISGRIMPPLQAIDFIGLDIYKAVIESIGLPCPTYIQKLISENKLGKKTGAGLYKPTPNNTYEVNTKTLQYEKLTQFHSSLIEKIKEEIKENNLIKAIAVLLESDTKEAKIIQYFFAKYIYVSFSIIGVAAQKIDDVDKAMAYGFNWVPPSALIDLIGGKRAAFSLLRKFHLAVPIQLSQHSGKGSFYTLQNSLDYSTFFRPED